MPPWRWCQILCQWSTLLLYSPNQQCWWRGWCYICEDQRNRVRMALNGPQLGPGVAHQLWHEGTTSVVWAQLKRWQDANQFQRRAQGLGVWQDIHGEAVSSVENECHKISLQFLIFVLILRVGMWCIFLCRTSNIIMRNMSRIIEACPETCFYYSIMLLFNT